MQRQTAADHTNYPNQAVSNSRIVSAYLKIASMEQIEFVLAGGTHTLPNSLAMISGRNGM
jgi:hypothetical protein